MIIEEIWDKFLDFLSDAGPCLVLIGAAIASVVTAVVLVKKVFYPTPVKKEEEVKPKEDDWEDNVWD